MNKIILIVVILLSTIRTDASHFTASETEELNGMLTTAITANNGGCNYLVTNVNKAHIETSAFYATFGTNTTVLADFTFINVDGSLATSTFMGQFNADMYEYYVSQNRQYHKPPYYLYASHNKRQKKYGPLSPNGAETYIMPTYCPGISSTSVAIDRDGLGGPTGDNCPRNDHYMYQETSSPYKRFLPVGPIQIIEVK